MMLRRLKRSLAIDNLLKARKKILKTAKIVSKKRKKNLQCVFTKFKYKKQYSIVNITKEETHMCNNLFGGNNCCLVIVLILVILCCCGNNDDSGCGCNNNGCGCGCGG